MSIRFWAGTGVTGACVRTGPSATRCASWWAELMRSCGAAAD